MPLEPGHRPTASSHIRFARPSRSLASAEHFWVTGLGLKVLWRSGKAETVEGGHELLMLGWPGAAWHLELLQMHADEALERPTLSKEEELLVLYLDGPVAPDVVDGLVQAGGKRVVSSNPYWEQWGVTVEDPDGYRVVLCQRGWENVAQAES